MTVTGLLPSPLAESTVPAGQRPRPSALPAGSEPAAEQGITPLGRQARSLLTLKGRPPFRLAGMETDERLSHVVGVSLDWLAKRYAPRRAHLYQGLQAAFGPFAEPYQTLSPGAAWLPDIAYL